MKIILLILFPKKIILAKRGEVMYTLTSKMSEVKCDILGGWVGSCRDIAENGI